MEYLPDRLLINDTLFLQQFMELNINRADDKKTLWSRRSKRIETGFVIRYLGNRSKYHHLVLPRVAIV